MRGKTLRSFACLLMTLVLALSLFGCGNAEDKNGSAATADNAASTITKADETKKEEVKKEPIKLQFPTFMCGTNVGAPWQTKILELFKEQYGNEIEVVVEELPSDQAYVDKMKILMASKDMPDVISGKNGLLELAVKGGLAVELDGYLAADPEWKEAIGEEALKHNSVNGKVYAIENSRAIVGYFYNKGMFQKAGIQPAKTWDEWFTNLDKLKATGVAPLALMTGENGWTTNLILASLIGTNGEAGNTFMNTIHPKSYETPEFIDALGKIKTMLKDYTTKDALGATYGVAANNFLSGKAAIIANGPWMISDFSNAEKAPAGFDKKVGAAVYPNGVFSSISEGWVVCSEDKEHAGAAVKLVKAHSDNQAQQLNLEMIGNFPLSPKVTVSDEYKKKNPILAELLEAVPTVQYNYTMIDNINYPNVMDQFATLYPALAMDKITPEGMAKTLSEVAAKN
ncbi:MAG: extracellular solute-binding protein [Clostridiaceae bacterium]